MRVVAPTIGLVLAVSALTGVASAGAETAQSASCSAQADKQSLSAADRQTFMARCVKGALAPPQPPIATTPGSGAHAVVAPSGHDKMVRSGLCNAEADRRGLHDRSRAAFRLSCLATAAPVRAVGTTTKPPAPTAAKPELGVKDASGQH